MTARAWKPAAPAPAHRANRRAVANPVLLPNAAFAGRTQHRPARPVLSFTRPSTRVAAAHAGARRPWRRRIVSLQLDLFQRFGRRAVQHIALDVEARGMEG